MIKTFLGLILFFSLALPVSAQHAETVSIQTQTSQAIPLNRLDGPSHIPLGAPVTVIQKQYDSRGVLVLLTIIWEGTVYTVEAHQVNL
jgi:hypothetical protein